MTVEFEPVEGMSRVRVMVQGAGAPVEITGKHKAKDPAEIMALDANPNVRRVGGKQGALPAVMPSLDVVAAAGEEPISVPSAEPRPAHADEDVGERPSSSSSSKPKGGS